MLLSSNPSELRNFTNYVLNRFYGDMHHYEGEDNFDAHRYPANDIRALDIRRGTFSLDLFTREQEHFFEVWGLLADETSKALFIDLIRFQLGGHLHVRLPTNNPEFFASKKSFKDYKSRPSALPFAPDSKIEHFEFKMNGKDVQIDGYISNIIWPLCHGQYFFRRDGVAVMPAAGDHVVDAGSCLGETAVIFGAVAGPSGAVYSFDLLANHCEATRFNMQQNATLCRFTLFEQGLSNKVHQPAAMVPASDAVQPSFNIVLDAENYPTTTLDHLIDKGEIERVDFIKMDIEGSELNALYGAEKCLRRFRPRLAISIYHFMQHFYEVPLFVNSLDLGYKFYLDHHTIHHEESVIYALPSG